MGLVFFPFTQKYENIDAIVPLHDPFHSEPYSLLQKLSSVYSHSSAFLPENSAFRDT